MYTLIAGKYVIDKDPSATLEYGIDLTEWLDGASILTATTAYVGVTGYPAVAPVINGGIITAWASGGTVNEKASLTFHFTTGNPDYPADSRTIYFNIKVR